MPHPAVPHRAQHGGLRIALHGVQHIAMEALHEAFGSIFDDGRAQAMHRLCRLASRDGLIDCRQTARHVAEAAADG